MSERVVWRKIDPDELLRPSAKSHQEAHVVAVRNIAEELYYFPTPDYPHYRTFVNKPEVEQKIFTNLGRELTPDIVVLEWPEKLARIVAAVVTPDMIDDTNADNWAVLSRLAGVQFYLYAPAGHAADVKKLLKKHKIKGVGLRTWRHITGLKTIDVAKLS
jgi:hypothetical protein